MHASVIYVAYRTRELDLAWLPEGTDVLVVHNDDSLGSWDDQRCRVRHLRPGANIGFGAAVNLASRAADHDRLVIVNPDTELEEVHFAALMGPPHTLMTIPLADAGGAAAPVISPYPTPLSWLLGASRVGRHAPLGSRRRRVVDSLVHLRPSHRPRAADPETTAFPPGALRRPIRTHWVSGAVFSIDRDRFIAVGGFDTGFFLYYEDTDLARRLRHAYPDMQCEVALVPPGIHEVGGSASVSGTSTVERVRLASALRYASTERGRTWQLARGIAKAWLPT